MTSKGNSAPNTVNSLQWPTKTKTNQNYHTIKPTTKLMNPEEQMHNQTCQTNFDKNPRENNSRN